MSEDLLLELGPPPQLAESLGKIEKLLLVHERDVIRAIEGMQGSARAFENTWRQIVLHVARGNTAEMQAARPHLLKALETRLAQLRLYQALATALHKQGRTDVPNPDVLLPEIEGLERMKTQVFASWETAEDLEDLAARDYPLTTADLDKIGPHRRPPASYYQEESKPF